LSQWVTKKTVEELARLAELALRRKGDNAMTEASQKFLHQHSEIEKLLPALFDRCDNVGCEFAFRLASMAKTPASLEALRGFAFSKRGTDKLRNEAAMILSQEGIIEDETVKM